MKIESNEILLQNFDLARIVNETEEHFPIVRYPLFKNTLRLARLPEKNFSNYIE